MAPLAPLQPPLRATPLIRGRTAGPGGTGRGVKQGPVSDREPNYGILCDLLGGYY